MLRWIACVFGISVAATAGGGVLPGADCVPVAGACPRILLATPVNATWAANHTDYWRGLGVEGFLFRGILDSFEEDLDVSVENPDGGPAEAPLLKEIRLAQDRLAGAGLTHNFLHVSLVPEARYFADAGLSDAAVTLLGRAGAFCRESGLCGIALDTMSSSFMHDFRWDGYDLETEAAADLRAGARDFGCRGLRAFIRECPETTILLIADRLDDAGPLWFHLFEGMAASLGAADTVRLQLLLREGQYETNPEILQAIVGKTHDVLEARLEPETWASWQCCGGIGLGAAPIGMRGGRTIAHYPAADFRVQLCAAKMCSSQYVWVEAPQGGWWGVTPDEAQGYAASRQGGAAAVRPLPLPPSALGDYTLRTPLDALRRVGPLVQDAFAVYVFYGETGAAVLAWQEGQSLVEAYRPRAEDPVTVGDAVSPEPGDGGRVSVQWRNTSPVAVTELRSGRRYRLRKDREEEIPPTAPILIEGLPLRDWAVPAALWMRLDAPLTPTVSRVGLRFGYTNVAAVTLEGVLEAWAPANYAVGSASFVVDLSPGESMSLHRTVQGVFQLGERPDFSLSLVLPGGGAVTRVFSFDVLPPLRWSVQRDGALLAASAVISAAEGSESLVVGGQRGDLVRYDSRGRVQWEKRLRMRFTTGVSAGHDGSGKRVLAVGSHRGVVVVLDGDGGLVGETDFGIPCQPGAFGYVALGGAGRDILVAGLEDGRVIGMNAEGTPVWRRDTGAKSLWLAQVYAAPAAAAAAGVFASARARGWVCIGADSTLLSLGFLGGLMWQGAVGSAITCAPLVVPWPNQPVWRVLTGDASGAVCAWDALSGKPEGSVGTASGQAIRGLAAGDILAMPGVEILAVDGANVYCYAADWTPLWETVVPLARHVAVRDGVETPLILVSTDGGALYALSTEGGIAWRDTRAARAVSAPAIARDLDGDGRFECLFPSADGALRVIDVGPLRRPPDLPRDAFEGEAERVVGDGHDSGAGGPQGHR